MNQSNNLSYRSLSAFLTALVLTLAFSASAFAQTTAFTYQGRFTDTTIAQPTNGTYTMTFRLFDAATGGNQIPNNTTGVTSMVSVINGIFTVKLDFGAAAFNASGARYLEIQVGSTILTPRQEITSTPFANRATNAAAADSLSANCVGCVTNAQINGIDGSKVTGTVANANAAAMANTATTANSATTAGNVTGIVAIANGGTGSATQNFVDLSSNQTIGGNKNFSGTLGGAGISNLVRVFTFSNGPTFSIAGSASTYTFTRAFTTVTLAANQRMTGAATAVLGKTTADSEQAAISLCYQLNGAGEIFDFTPSNFNLVQFTATRLTYSATASVANLAAGTYRVGLCVKNTGSTAINNNDFTNGWVMVTNN